jgi:potassium efflux system protein
MTQQLPRIVFILAVLATLQLQVSPSWAQQAGNEPSRPAAAQSNPSDSESAEQVEESITRWNRVLERIAEQVADPNLSSGVYRELRETIVDIQRQISAARPALANDTERIRKLLEALGPAPKEGELAEAAEIAAKRAELNDQLAEQGGRLKNLDLLFEKSRGIDASISEAQSTALGNKLLARTPSLFSLNTWTKSASQARSMATRAANGLAVWYNSERVQSAIESGYLVITLIAVLAGAVVGLLLRRALVRRYGRRREIEHPTYRMRVRAALAEAAARTVIPIVVASAAYGGLSGGGFLGELSDRIAFGIVLVIMVVSILYGLPRAMLSPSIPQWRLIALGNHTARLWFRYALVLAALTAIDLFLIISATALGPPEELQTIYGFIIGTAYAIAIFLIAADRRLWRTPVEEARERAHEGMPEDGVPAGPETGSRWWLIFRLVSAVMAVTIVFFAMTGYGVLSNFIARRMLATGAVILVAFILHGLARDVVAMFTREIDKPASEVDEVNPFYVWSVLILDVGLVLSMAFIVVPIWGGQWDRLMDRLGWSLTGFRIGDRVFSITDVVAGMVAFIILLAIVRFTQHFIRQRILLHTRIDSGVRDSLITVIGYVGLVIAAMIAITITGIDLSGLTIVAGALSVGVGFGLQSIVNNFVSGLILLAERPIKVGDWVQVGNYEGVVQRISVRSTEIKTFERASVILPNSDLISSAVINWVHQDKTGRIDLLVGVSYDSDPEEVRRILLEVAEQNETILKNPAPYVLFRDFGSDALMFELRGFVSDVTRRLRISSQLRFSIEKAFREAGISIPFPQRDLHIKDAERLAELFGNRNQPRKKAATGKTATRRSATTRHRRIRGDTNTDPDGT